MKLRLIQRAAALALIVSGVTTGALAQTPSHPHNHQTQFAQTPAATHDAGQGHGASGMMGHGMMGQSMSGMMQPGMTSGTPTMPMRGHLMKIMFVIADANGDGGISFDELTIIYKRLFDKVDVNKDSKVTPDEVLAFMLE